MEYLRVKNWQEFQHYKDRTPPWIKLYNHLLDDFEFSCLPDASKAHLLSIWLLASRTENRIPNNAKWISNKINATDDVDINLLLSTGFIERIPNENNELQTLEQDASKALQEAEQDACTEREERESRERAKKEKEQRIKDAFDEFWSSYHVKKNKPTAEKAFTKAVEREKPNDLQEFVSMLAKDCKTRIASDEFGFDRLHASTYLNNNRWEDEVSLPESQNKTENSISSGFYDGYIIR
jgi:flagellar biosynthesis GTPase FlhF